MSPYAFVFLIFVVICMFWYGRHVDTVTKKEIEDIKKRRRNKFNNIFNKDKYLNNFMNNIEDMLTEEDLNHIKKFVKDDEIAIYHKVIDEIGDNCSEKVDCHMDKELLEYFMEEYR